MSKTLTMTIVFQANSLNYNEGIANISELKKFHRANGEVHTFSSRQSLRYDMVRLGNELFDWNLDTVDKASGVVQFKKEVTIKDSVEMDLFGYLKTGKKSEKRSAVARVSHAISLEPYRGDMEFLNNMGLATRINQDPNLANIEQHESLYAYTITIDLNRVGIDGDVLLPQKERAERVHQFLDIVKFLNRDIRGRRENLAPLFVIGGVYDVANPFFLGKVGLKKETGKWELNVEPLVDAVELTFMGKPIREQTNIGIVKGTFDNQEELEAAFSNRVGSIEDFFNIMFKEVSGYYGEE